MRKKITAKTILAEILKKPGSEKILIKYHLPCLSCPLAEREMEKLTISQVCQMYHLNLKGLLDELNKL